MTAARSCADASPPQANLALRFRQDQIYTYVGTVLIAINPFRLLPLYTTDVLEKCAPATPGPAARGGRVPTAPRIAAGGPSSLGPPGLGPFAPVKPRAAAAVRPRARPGAAGRTQGASGVALAAPGRVSVAGGRSLARAQTPPLLRVRWTHAPPRRQVSRKRFRWPEAAHVRDRRQRVSQPRARLEGTQKRAPEYHPTASRTHRARRKSGRGEASLAARRLAHALTRPSTARRTKASSCLASLAPARLRPPSTCWST